MERKSEGRRYAALTVRTVIALLRLFSWVRVLRPWRIRIQTLNEEYSSRNSSYTWDS